MATDDRVLLHGDLSDDHILLHGDRLGGVIDFTDAQAGDPAFDFTVWPGYGEPALERMIAAYGASGVRAQALADRARRWFVRYRLEQVWWDQTGARAYLVEPVAADLERRLEALGF
jgi:aminoglycoside phosphotransferase (APT) family kinase protein